MEKAEIVVGGEEQIWEWTQFFCLHCGIRGVWYWKGNILCTTCRFRIEVPTVLHIKNDPKFRETMKKLLAWENLNE